MHQRNKLPSEIRRLLNPALVAACVLPGAALAGPMGGEVVRGSATIGNPDPVTTLVNQQSDKAVVNWQAFSVAGEEFVIFNQPDASAVILNRVIGNNASEIFGTIEANGQVFLVNPNGIFFGPGATLDVHGLVASTLDIADDDFMDGNYVFTRDPDAPDASVVNAGEIHAADGGYVVLAGDYVKNEGLVAARVGHVMMGSGSQVTLDIEGDGLVSFAVDEKTLAELAGVENTGDILADGSIVLMTAKVADELVSSAVNNEGFVAARSVEEHDGAIVLRGEGGDVVNRGTLVADGDGVDGGIVRLLSDRDVHHADGASISADGGADATGGDIRLIARRDLFVEQGSTISAQGGAQGGFVEVSGHESFRLHGDITIGNGGELLIDPSTITIVPGTVGPDADVDGSTVGVGYIENQLNFGTDVRLVASDVITADEAVTEINAIEPDEFYGAGNFSLNIGEAYSGNLNCDSFGVCTGFNSENAEINSSGSTGTINLGHVTINIAGNFGALGDPSFGGTIELGNVAAGGDILIKSINMSSLDAIEIKTGDLTSTGTGDIFVMGASEQAPVHIELGDVTTTDGDIFLEDKGGSILVPSLHTGDVTSSGAVGMSSTTDIHAGNVTAGSWIHFALNGALTTGNLTAVESLAVTDTSFEGPVGGPVQTGDITVTNETGEAWVDIRSQNDIQTGSVTVSGTTTDPELDETSLILESAAGGITIDGDLHVEAGSAHGLTRSHLIARSGEVHITGDNTFLAGTYPLFVEPFHNEYENRIEAVSLRIDGTTTNNYSLRVIVDGGIETGDIIGRRVFLTAGDAVVLGDMDLTRSIAVDTGGDITTGNIDIVTPGPDDTPDPLEHTPGQIFLETASGTVTTGDLSIDSWRANNIQIFAREIHTGGIEQTTRPYEWDSTTGGPTWTVASRFVVPWSEQGTATVGSATLRLGRDDGSTTEVTVDGAITMDAIGHTQAVLQGDTVAVTGPVDLNASGASIDSTGILTPEDQPFLEAGDLLMEGTFELQAEVGRAALFVLAPDSATFADDITITGPYGLLSASTASWTGQAVTVTGTGETMDLAVFDTDGNHAGDESRSMGRALVTMSGPEGASFEFAGDITATGSGDVDVILDADAIAAQSVSVTSALGASSSDGVFDLVPGESATGEWEQGDADILLGRDGADISLAGGIQSHGQGRSVVELIGADISVAGDIGITSGPAQLDITWNGRIMGPDESTWDVERVTTGTESFADLLVEAGGAVSLGDISIEGGDILIEIEGASVTIGDLSASASGFSMFEQETWDNPATGESFTLTEDIDASPVFAMIGADSSVSTGDIDIAAEGLAILLLEGGSVATGGLAARATEAGAATFSDSRSGDSFTLDTAHAVIGILGTDAATIDGDLTLESASFAHLGASGEVSGTVRVDAGVDIDPDVSALVELIEFADLLEDPLDPADEDDGFPGLPAMHLQAGSFQLDAGRDVLLSGATLTSDGGVAANAGRHLEMGDVSAASLGFVTDSGDIDLTGSALAVDGDASLLAGTDIVVSGATIDAGTLSMTAGGDIRNQEGAGIDAGALAMFAGGDIALGESTISVGDGTFEDIGGDPDAIALFAEHELVPADAAPNATFVAQGSLGLGSMSFAGTYLYLQAGSFSMAGEFTAPEHDFVVQATAYDDGAGIVLEGDAGEGVVRVGYSDFLSGFGTASFIVGHSGHGGDITVDVPDELDIGDSNLLLASTGTVSGLGLVTTTGLVGSMEGIARVGEPEPEPDPGRDFDTPTSGEIVGTETTGDYDHGDDPAPPPRRRAQEQDDDDEDDETADVELGDDPDSDDTLTTHESADQDLVCE